MTQLAATILFMLTVYVGRDYRPVYLQHLRETELGPELGAQELAERYLDAADRAGVDVADLYALGHDESGQNPRRVSPAGALGRLQLLPASRWGRGWLRECAPRNRHDGERFRVGFPAELDLRAERKTCEGSNVLWGAYALRDALVACCGVLVLAYGFYRTGKCVAGPRSRRTAKLADWVRWRLHG
jgi:hypothetical protein